MKLLELSVKRTLFRMAFPMLAGTAAVNFYNLADTWFVARLGTIPLAAMGFVFPVVMLLSFLAGGIGTGVTTLTSHALGRRDYSEAARIVTHGFILMILFSALISILGYLSITPLFRRLGADDQVLPLIRDYMRTWYLGAVFMALPMVGRGILISLGDSKSAALFMVFGSLLNCLLDPILIFGYLGFPALGIWGAALATVIAQTLSSIWLFYLLAVKHRLLRPRTPELAFIRRSTRRIMGFAIPGSISMMLMPLSAGVIIALISRYGNEAVAGVSAAARIEVFAFVIPMALGISLVPFVSQNFGAGRMDRIREAKTYATRFAFLYGLLVALAFFLAAPLLARVFTREAKVAEIFILYVRTISFGYGLMEIHRYCGLIMTGMQRPVLATALSAFRVLVLLLPLSFLGSSYFGIRGIFTARLLTDLAAGVLGLLWVSWLIHIRRDKAALPAAG